MKKISIMGSMADYNPVTGQFAGTVATKDRMLMAMLFNYINDKQWRMVFSKFCKKRTIGEKSQSHRLNGFLQQISQITGMDFDMLKIYFKQKAISRGLSFNTDPEGNAIAISEVQMTTIEASYVIDEIEQYAAEENIWLYEGLN